MKLSYHNIAPLMKPHGYGYHTKTILVLHETVSPDIPGWGDINGVAAYLAGKNYAVHGLTDAEAHIAYTRGEGKAIYSHAGGVNSISIGIEQISRVMLQAPTNKLRRQLWAARQPQLRATAKLIAAICDAHPIPLRYSDSRTPGITTHWDVSRFHSQSEGHTDCFPYHKGGYYPVLEVIRMAVAYSKVPGYTL